MRIRWLALSALVVLMLQLAWPTRMSTMWVVPNFFLVYLVLMSIYVDATRLLWLALAGGLVLDLMGGPAQFGLNMAFYILTALVLKLVWQLDARNLQATTLVLVTLGFTVLYGLLAHMSLLGIGYIAQWRGMSWRIVVEALWNCVIVALSVSVIQLRQRGIISS